MVPERRRRTTRPGTPAAPTDPSGSTGEATGDTGGADEGSGAPDSTEHGKGKTISELAHSTPGPGKGKIISVVASGRKSHAGQPPGQAKKGGDGAGSHRPDHPDHSTGAGNGHKHGGSATTATGRSPGHRVAMRAAGHCGRAASLTSCPIRRSMATPRRTRAIPASAVVLLSVFRPEITRSVPT